MAISLLSPVSDIYRRDVSVDDNNLVTPTHADCLVAGEWVVLNASGEADIDARAANSALAFQVFTEKGDYSAQALGKVTLLNSFDYIAETDQYTGSPSAGDYLAINSDGVLAVHTAVDWSGSLTSGTAAAMEVVVAVALQAPSGGLLKYQRISPFRH